MDSDPGTAGHLPHGVLGQTGVDAIIFRQGVLDVELGHASLTGGVSILDGLLCGGKHRKAQAGGGKGSPVWGCSCHVIMFAQIHWADDVFGHPLASWIEEARC